MSRLLALACVGGLASVEGSLLSPKNYPVSVDGKPVLTSFAPAEVLAVDWSARLSAENPLRWFMQPAVPFVLVALYLFVSKPLVAMYRDAIGLKPESGLLKLFVFLHNVALAVFSGWVSWYSWPLLVRKFSEGQLKAVHCDASFWEDATYGFGYWAQIFFVSKFYEFVDTWILVLKQKQPSFLQVYHHTGIVLSMAMAVWSQAQWLIWVVCLNSFIHTVMYTYYALRTIGVPVPSRYAKVLTNCQMTQFLIGITLSSSTYVYRFQGGLQGCPAANDGALASLGAIHLYTVGLLYLFNEMAKQKYASKKK